MNFTLLQSLQDWRSCLRPCALVTNLSSGAAVLLGDAIQVGALTLDEGQRHEVSARIASDRSGMMTDDLFVRVYVPPSRLIVVGAVHIASFLVPIARLAGFDVTVVDPRQAFAGSEQMSGIATIVGWPDEVMVDLMPDSRTAVVTLTHDPKMDDPALAAALRSQAFYIGALGSRKTHAKRLERLKAAGFADIDLARIHGPVGLDINALTPAEIAVSIMAQIVAILRSEAE